MHQIELKKDEDNEQSSTNNSNNILCSNPSSKLSQVMNEFYEIENYENIDEIEMSDYKQFPWFIAGMLTSIENPLIRRIAPLSLFHIRFYCEAYMKALYLEYKTEKRHRINHIK